MSRNYLTKNDVNTERKDKSQSSMGLLQKPIKLTCQDEAMVGLYCEDEKQKEQNNLKNIVEVLSVCGRICDLD